MGAGGSSRKGKDGAASSNGKKSKDKKKNQNCDAERQAVVLKVLELSNIDEPSHEKLKALTTSLRRNRHPPPDPLLVQSLDGAICKLVYEACSSGNGHMLRQLLEKHGDQYAHAKLFYAEGLTPLMLACQNTNMDVIATLIEKNANPNERNNFQSAAIHYAASLQATALPLVLLLEAGADPDPRNQLQATPALHLLSNRLLDLDQQRLAMMLLKFGGLDLNKPDYDGNSLVFHANLQTTGGLHAVLCANPTLTDTGKSLTMGSKIVRAEVLKALMDCSPPQLNSAINGLDAAELDGQSIVFYKDIESKWVSQAAHRNPNWKQDLVRALHIMSETHPHFDIDRQVDHGFTSTLMLFMLECCVDPQYTPLFKHPIEAQIIEVLLAAGASPSCRRQDGLTPMVVGLICRPSEEDLEDDEQKLATRELCFNTIHKTIITRYKLSLLTKMIDKKGHTALDLAAKMVSLANVDGELMLATPWGLRPNPKEAIQVYNQLYRQITEDDDWMRRRAPLDRTLATAIATKILLPLFRLVASDELTGDAAQCYEYLLWNDMGAFLMSEAAEQVEEVRNATLSSIQEQIDAAWEETGSQTDTQLFLANAKHPDRKPKPLGSLQEPVLPNRILKTGALTHQIEALRFPIKSKGTFTKPTLPTPLAFITRLDAAAAVEACLSVGGITPVQYTAWLEQAPPSGSRFEYFWSQIMGFFLKGLGAMGDAALLAGLKPRVEAMVQVAAGGLPVGHIKAEMEAKTDVEGPVGAATKMGEEDNNGDGDEDESINMEIEIDNDTDLDTDVNIGDDDESEHKHDPDDLSDDDQSDNDGADTTTATTAGEDPAPRLVVWSPTDDANALWRIQHHKRQYREATVTACGSALVQSYSQCRGVSSQVAVSEPFHPFEQGGNLGISRAAVVSDSDEQLLLDRAMLVGLDIEKDGMQVVGETNAFATSGTPCITLHLLVRLPHPRFKHVICEVMLLRRQVFEVLNRTIRMRESLQTLQRHTETSRKFPKSLKVRFKPQQAVRLSR